MAVKILKDEEQGLLRVAVERRYNFGDYEGEMIRVELRFHPSTDVTEAIKYVKKQVHKNRTRKE